MQVNEKTPPELVGYKRTNKTGCAVSLQDALSLIMNNKDFFDGADILTFSKIENGYIRIDGFKEVTK